jgi:hypothetical protein
LSQDKSSWKDLISTIIAAVALSGIGFNIYNIRQLKKNRSNDNEKDKFIFWLKEIIFPEYLSPVLKALKMLNIDYQKIIQAPESYNQSEKETFQKKWSKEKLELKDLFVHAAELPYLSDVFSDLLLKINELDDKIITLFYPTELVIIPSDDDSRAIPSTTISNLSQTLTGDELTHLVSNIYSRINAEQARYSS